MDAREKAVSDAIIRALETCGEPDIEAGIGALLGIGSDERIASFRKLIATAALNAISRMTDKSDSRGAGAVYEMTAQGGVGTDGLEARLSRMEDTLNLIAQRLGGVAGHNGGAGLSGGGGGGGGGAGTFSPGVAGGSGAQPNYYGGGGGSWADIRGVKGGR
jgi:hypothetical protein